MEKTDHTDYGLCQICERQLVDPATEDWTLEWALDTGGICSGCDALMHHKAVWAFCPFHGQTCIVANHYAESVHLCHDDECIEHQDITTLMINASYARWKHGGGENAFFDRMAKISEELEAGTAEVISLSGMTQEEQRRALFGDDA